MGEVKMTKDSEFPKVIDFQFRSHMHLSNQGIRVDGGTIVWPGNPIHGKLFVRRIRTPKSKSGNWGKGVASFCISEKKEPEFKTVEAFIDHYTITEDKKIEYSGQTEKALRVKVKPEALKKRNEELKKKKSKS